MVHFEDLDIPLGTEASGLSQLAEMQAPRPTPVAPAPEPAKPRAAPVYPIAPHSDRTRLLAILVVACAAIALVIWRLVR